MMQKRKSKATKGPALITRTKPGEIWRQLKHCFHSSGALMDYLHGDVPEDQAGIACMWEYGRESKVLWDIAAARDRSAAQNKGRGPRTSLERILLEMDRRDGGWYPLPPFYHFLRFAAAFPKKAWNESSKGERDEILRLHPSGKPSPLPVADIGALKGWGITDSLVSKAEALRRSLDEDELKQPEDADFHLSSGIYCVAFKIDYSAGRAGLLKSFTAWLNTKENRERLEKNHNRTANRTDKALDRLKALAVWRLYREMDNDYEATNRFANQHRKHFKDPAELREKCKTDIAKHHRYKPGSPRPFRDAKPKGGQPPNAAELLGEDSDGRKAKASALDFLSQIIPAEFPAALIGKPSGVYEEIERMFRSGGVD